MLLKKQIINLGMVFSISTGIFSVMASEPHPGAEAESKGAPRSPAESDTQIEDLPSEMLVEIFDHLPNSDLVNAAQVSQNFYKHACIVLEKREYKNSKNVLDRVCKKPVDNLPIDHALRAAKKVKDYPNAHPQTKAKALYIIALASNNRLDFNNFTEAYNALDESGKTALLPLRTKLASTFR